MPLYREWSSDPYSLAAIWEIAEPESFFLERTRVHTDIKNPKKRLEHLAGRFLLKHLEEDFPLLNIHIDEHDKPRLPDNEYFFSISHSYPYVAVVVSPFVECGIDIQVWHPRMELLQHKFLSEKEQKLFTGDPQLLTLAWSAKEAAYKWQGRRGVDFIEHLPIQHLQKEDGLFQMDVLLRLSSPFVKITVKGMIEKDFACCYTASTRNR
ncbi:MAG TPA: 4'-phosphopantetheinyl transferase superfamily protein [Flavipsychrobacter sp.]|nr:4'-phosphopantetheinyl transferase superfamily protein [Flavipsychrobacter sp.]